MMKVAESSACEADVGEIAAKHSILGRCGEEVPIPCKSSSEWT